MLEILLSHRYEISGLIGAGFYVSSYFLLQAGWLSGDSSWYTVLNLAASSFLLLSLLQQFNLGAAVLQIFWIAMSLFGLARTSMITLRKSTLKQLY